MSTTVEHELKRRARLGEVLLGLRTVVVQLTVLGGTVVLARLLDPRDFGIFAVVQFVLSFFAIFGDAGLGAALVQQKGVPKPRELSSVFWLQLVLALAVAGVVSAVATYVHVIWATARGWFALGAIADAGGELPEGASWLLRALSFGLVAAVLRATPSILMERELQFGRLAVLDVASTVGFYAVAITLGWLGFGTWALCAGVVTQAFLTAALALVLRPWRPLLVIDRELLRPLLRYGIPFQLRSMIGFANNAVAPVYAASALGPQPLGYINWAQNTAYFPLKLVEIMARVTFPLLSRMQDDKKMFAESLMRSIYVCGVGTFFFVGLIFGIGEPLVVVLYTAKWVPAMPLLYIYAGAISIGFLAPVVAAAFDATGRPQVFLRLSIGWTILAWAVVPFTTPRWGMVGFVAGFCVHVIVGNLVVVWLLHRTIPEAKIWKPLGPAVAGGIAVALLGRYLLAGWIGGPITLVASILASAAVFVGIALALDRKRAREALALLKRKKKD